MRKFVLVLLLLLCAVVVIAQEPIYDYFVYLPAVAHSKSAPTPTVRPTLAPPTYTPTPRPTLAPVICDCSDDLYNCPDFATQAAAQACYNYCVSQGHGDVHRLDRDKDGIVCEWLT